MTVRTHRRGAATTASASVTTGPSFVEVSRPPSVDQLARSLTSTGLPHPLAVEVARANLAANGLDGRVACVEAPGFQSDALAALVPYDLIIANILKGPLIDIAPELAHATGSGGQVILSGILNEQADEVVDVYRQHGLNCLHREVIVDWTTLLLVK